MDSITIGQSYEIEAVIPNKFSHFVVYKDVFDIKRRRYALLGHTADRCRRLNCALYFLKKRL